MAQEIDFKQDFNDYKEAWNFLKKALIVRSMSVSVLVTIVEICHIVKLQNEIERRKSEYLRLRDEYNKQIS